VIVRRDLTAPSRRDAEALRGLLNAEPCIGMIRAIGAQGVVRPACPFACEQLREVAGPDECFHVGTAPPQAIALATKRASEPAGVALCPTSAFVPSAPAVDSRCVNFIER